jgi:hypothetical protein
MDVFKGRLRKALLRRKQSAQLHGWISVGMPLTFRAEVMPGLDRDRRTFTVAQVLTDGRVELRGLFGQHGEAEFEPLR